MAMHNDIEQLTPPRPYEEDTVDRARSLVIRQLEGAADTEEILDMLGLPL